MLSAWFLLFVTAAIGISAQQALTNPDSLPSISELPDPFLRAGGTRINTRSEWKVQRSALRDSVLKYEYGALPPVPRNMTAKEISSRKVEGLEADEKVILLSMGPQSAIHTHITLTLPHGKGPFPVIIRGDFIAGDKFWKRVDPAILEAVTKRGYALAEFDRAEIAPDSAERAGLYAAYPNYTGGRLSAWAWGYHRVVDYLLEQKWVDRQKIIITGHSRGGKAALLAGASDERIALTAPNNSGCGGAGCYRDQVGNSEDISAILKNFPFWFDPGFNRFIGHVDQLPFDQHTVKALVAPRALLTTEGLEDHWANPEGTQQSYLAAKEVYKFLGAEDRCGIVFRPGGHDQGLVDWETLLDFADRQLYNKTGSRRFDQLAFSDAKLPFSWKAPGSPVKAASNAAAFPGKVSDYHGFARRDFTVDGCNATVVSPKSVAAGAPWIWRAEFFDHRPEIDLALVSRGFHLVYIEVGNTFGAPDAMRHWDAFYSELTGKYRLSKKPVLEGVSRGGLYVYNWAAANPTKTGVIFGDNPVCDFKSWPGGKGKGPGSPADWKKLIKDYGFKSEAEALAYTKNPVDNLASLAKAKVPIIHIAGDADEVVPYPENTVILADRYRKLGGNIKVIVKSGFHHHPHGLDDPSPVVDFILKAVSSHSQILEQN